MPPLRHNSNKAASRLSLSDIFDDTDEFGLLNVEAKRVNSSAPLDMIRFEEVNQFIDHHKRLPEATGNLLEKGLARRLQGYITHDALHDRLRPYDRHQIIPVLTKSPVVDVLSPPVPVLIDSDKVTSMDDIFNSIDFDLLDMGDTSLFDIQHVPVVSKRDNPDEIAQRTICADFFEFESIFRELHQRLKAGSIAVTRFQSESQTRQGDAFILQGVLCFVDQVGEYQEDNEGRYNPRLRVIFENGTESNLLLRSLGKALYKDETGRRIIPDADSVEEAFNNITHKDKRSGVVYIVTTKSPNSELKSIPNLHKIGYTELTVEERTKNAERDTAFLEAPVKILVSIECYNMNPNQFEGLIHGFLHAQRIKMTLTGKNGKTYHPQEWFSVPLDTAREVVRRIIDGSIVHYRMDNTTGRMKEKDYPTPRTNEK